MPFWRAIDPSSCGRTLNLIQVKKELCNRIVSGHVRFGSKADIEAPSPDVCFTPKSRHRPRGLACPLCAISRRRTFILSIRRHELAKIKGLQYQASWRFAG